MEEWDAEIEFLPQEMREVVPFPVEEISKFNEGWDKTIYLVNRKWLFCFPRRKIAIPGMRRESRYLRSLQPSLPLLLPEIQWFGEIKKEGTSWPFLAYEKIEGFEWEPGVEGLAESFGSFLKCLHSLSPSPVSNFPLPVDPFGRGEVSTRISKTRMILDELQIPIGQDLKEILNGAESLEKPRKDILVHGDLHFRHLFLNQTKDKLSAVLDWGDLQLSDASVDLQGYWALFSVPEREEFLGVYGEVDFDTLCRARILALNLNGALALQAKKTGKKKLYQKALTCLSNTLG